MPTTTTIVIPPSSVHSQPPKSPRDSPHSQSPKSPRDSSHSQSPKSPRDSSHSQSRSDMDSPHSQTLGSTTPSTSPTESPVSPSNYASSFLMHLSIGHPRSSSVSSYNSSSVSKRSSQLSNLE